MSVKELTKNDRGNKYENKIRWLNYGLYCYNRGLANGNYKNFKQYMEENICKKVK